MKSREEGLAQLEAGTIDGFASDRVLLAGLASKAKNPKALALLVDALSYEPYAIVLPRGDWAMRQAVDSALAQIYAEQRAARDLRSLVRQHGPPGPGARDHVRAGSPARVGTALTAQRTARSSRSRSTGLTRCSSKPAARVRARSSGWP